MNDLPYVSIVTGTFNRLKRLKMMIESTRLSVGVGIPYEIVLVDGGSTDGTLDYLKSQSDVVLIEQGKLVGAVKAFRAGFDAARGKYVIIANDDVTFRYESIQNSVAIMDDDPTIGMGCFPHNRYGAEYKVAKQPVVRDGRQTTDYYGQICIVPKWLGDKVGWWDPGVGYHTYAGDNELTCNIQELGLKVVALESCCVDDFVEKDELRKINSQNTQAGTIHPDSLLWRNKWSRRGLVGPVIPKFPTVSVESRKVPRMIYAPIYEDEAFPIQLKTKKGLREALSKRWLVSEISYRRHPELLYYGISMFNPDMVLIQYHDTRSVDLDLLNKIKSEFPKVILVSWNGDYSKERFANKDYKRCLKIFDLATFVCMDIQDEYLRDGINYRYWQIGFEEHETMDVLSSEAFDAVFQGNCYSKQRQAMGEMLRSHKEWHTGLYGKWPSHLKENGNSQYDFKMGDWIYRSSKIAIGDNGFPDSYAYVSNRLFQALHSGAFVLQQHIPGMTEVLGLEDEKHLIIWKDIWDLEKKIEEWLPRSSERSLIGSRGKSFVDMNHSFDSRVDELCEMLSAAGLPSPSLRR